MDFASNLPEHPTMRNRIIKNIKHTISFSKGVFFLVKKVCML